SKDQAKCTRTFIAPSYSFAFAPHNVNYHLEHHLHPTVPFYRLPELNHRLVGEHSQEHVYFSYQAIQEELIKRPKTG
ncbi:unnamed protein product, partial [marine sediment metagenome]